MSSDSVRKAYASFQSQFGTAPVDVEDTEEMFWLRESDDYASRVKLGSLLASQYRFREAVAEFQAAAVIRSDDPALFIRLGGAFLTLRQFEPAMEAYQKSLALGASPQSVSYPMGVWYYLNQDYQHAASCFENCLPCGDELAIAVLYWHALSCCRGNLPDHLLETYHENMKVGHHTAYRSAVEVLLGKTDAESTLMQADNDPDPLNAVIAMYGIILYMECRENSRQTGQYREKLLSRSSVWPCISWLAAWNDHLLLT